MVENELNRTDAYTIKPSERMESIWGMQPVFITSVLFNAPNMRRSQRTIVEWRHNALCVWRNFFSFRSIVGVHVENANKWSLMNLYGSNFGWECGVYIVFRLIERVNYHTGQKNMFVRWQLNWWTIRSNDELGNQALPILDQLEVEGHIYKH